MAFRAGGSAYSSRIQMAKHCIQGPRVRPEDLYKRNSTWGLPKIKGTFLGVPITRTIVFWGLFWGSPTLGSYCIFRKTPTHNVDN